MKTDELIYHSTIPLTEFIRMPVGTEAYFVVDYDNVDTAARTITQYVRRAKARATQERFLFYSKKHAQPFYMLHVEITEEGVAKKKPTGRPPKKGAES